MTCPPTYVQPWIEFMSATPSPTDVAVGQVYPVPCATTTIKWRDITHIVPLVGVPHEDRAIVGFHPWHVHIDVRFLSIDEWMALQLISSIIPLSRGDNDDPTIWVDSTLGIVPLPACRQAAPEWPAHEAPFQEAMEAAHQHCQPVQNRCPHRGIDLRCGRRVADGGRQCPGHGLWWAADGSLVRRAGTV